MDIQEFKSLLIESAKKIDIILSDEQVNKFYKYMSLLIEWNKKINLTAITEPKDIILKHFIDSMTISKYIKDSDRIIDVGTGAGFPGIPIKIIKEENEIVLLDSLNKRISFLNEVIKELGLNNINCIHSRAEEAGRNKNFREKFDISTSRAVANMSVLSEYLIPFTKMGGKVIFMKGSEIEQELEDSKNAIKLLGGKINKIDNFYLPNSDMQRNVILIDKIEKTNSKYPRKPGTPTKEPIK